MAIRSVIVTVPMKKFWGAMNSPFILTVLLAVKIGALCFSVGEGLRLTPFPVPIFTPTQYAQFSFTNTSDKISLSQYGPLDVPKQNQKRSKRQVDVAAPAVAGTKDLVPESAAVLACELIDVTSVLLVPGPSGRAPPFLS
jgi:hypothetical protein